MILHEIFRLVSRFPRYISCYIAERRLSLGQCGPVSTILPSVFPSCYAFLVPSLQYWCEFFITDTYYLIEKYILRVSVMVLFMIFFVTL